MMPKRSRPLFYEGTENVSEVTVSHGLELIFIEMFEPFCELLGRWHTYLRVLRKHVKVGHDFHVICL